MPIIGVEEGDEALKAFEELDAPTETEPVGRGGRDVGLGGSLVAGFASNKDEEIRYAASQLFPNVPLDQAVKRFGLRDGQVIYRADDGNVYPAFPAEGARGMAGSAAYGVGRALPAAAGTVAGIATAPMLLGGPPGMAASMGVTGGAAAGGEAVRQGIGDVLMGDAAVPGVDPSSVAMEAGAGALGQGIGAGLTGLAGRGVARDIAKLDRPQAQQALQEAEAVGVPLTPAEATGLPTLGAQQKRLSNITPTQDVMQEFQQGRDAKVVDAFTGFLDNISTAADAEDVGRLGREAAKGVLGDIKTEMLERARPLYEQAFEEGDRALWSPALERLTGSPAVKSAMQGAVNKWRDNAIADGFGAMNPGATVDPGGTIKFQKGGIPAFPNLQFWDYTKRSLDMAADAAAKAGKNDRARVLGKLARELRGELDNIGPQTYAQARQTYGTGADNLATAMESALGIVAETKDTNIINAAKHIFNPSTRSPQMVARLRQTIEGKDPQAWQAMKRLYMQDVFTDALKVAETGGITNPAGKIFKAFSNPKMRQNIYAAMSKDERKNFDLLMGVYQKASSVPAMRSDTAFNQLVTKEAEAKARPFMAKVAKNLNPAAALRNFDEWATTRNLEKDAATMADLITSNNPQVLDTMKELRRLKPRDARFRALFGHALTIGTRLGASQLMPGENREPSQ